MIGESKKNQGKKVFLRVAENAQYIICHGESTNMRDI